MSLPRHQAVQPNTALDAVWSTRPCTAFQRKTRQHTRCWLLSLGFTAFWRKEACQAGHSSGPSHYDPSPLFQHTDTSPRSQTLLDPLGPNLADPLGARNTKTIVDTRHVTRTHACTRRAYKAGQSCNASPYIPPR